VTAGKSKTAASSIAASPSFNVADHLWIGEVRPSKDTLPRRLAAHRGAPQESSS